MRFSTLMSICCCLAFLIADSYLQAQPPGRPGGRGQQQGRGGGGGGGGQRGGGRQGQGRPAQGGQAGQQSPPWIGFFDNDGDGEISADEIRNATASLLKLDRNSDGRLTGDELRPTGGFGAQARPGVQGGPGGGQQMRGQQGQRGGPGGGGQGSRNAGGSGGRGPGGGGRGGDPAQADAAFAAQIMSLDANKDGLMTLAELPGHMNEAFEIADADKDGSLNETELLVLASQFRRNKLNPNADQEMKNAPTQQGRRPTQGDAGQGQGRGGRPGGGGDGQGGARNRPPAE